MEEEPHQRLPTSVFSGAAALDQGSAAQGMSLPLFRRRNWANATGRVMAGIQAQLQFDQPTERLQQVCALAHARRLAGVIGSGYEIKAPFNVFHSGIVIFRHRAVVYAGIDHRRVQPPMTEEPLDRRHPTADIQELRCIRMAQAIGRDLDADPLPRRLDPVADQVFVHRPVATRGFQNLNHPKTGRDQYHSPRDGVLKHPADTAKPVKTGQERTPVRF
jgi:hypothetical protein